MKHQISVRMAVAIFLFLLCSRGATGWCAGSAQAGALNAGKLAAADAAILKAIEESKIPGAVLWIEHKGAVYQKAYGRRAVAPSPEPMTADTIFDAASLTKVVATTPSIMLLCERGKLKLENTVRHYIPEFAGDGREAITVLHLLTHTSGLRPGLSRNPPWTGYDTGIQHAVAEKPQTYPGTAFRYSDINFILLGEVVRRVSGRTLDQFAAAEIFKPLGMKDTGFLPSGLLMNRIAPTEKTDTGMLRGVVHDPTSRLMGGVAGHAGLFTTANDLARYARMMLQGGELDGVRLFQTETVRRITTVQTAESVGDRRGIGWDIDSGYSRPRGKLFPVGSYGHTGFTGTCLWIDPFSETFYVFLSNRVHPDGKGNVLPLQQTLGNLAAMVVDEFDFAQVSAALPARAGASSARSHFVRVLNGIDVLEQQKFAPLRKLRVGLITNHSGVNRNRRPTIDILRAAPEVKLVALFSPEHGIRGQLDEKVGDGVDEATGLPVYSLYGTRRAPTPDQLRDLDALVYDIQDIGCRFYTYISTLGLCMEAAGKAGKKFIILDRVNPINGVTIEGPVHRGASSFTAFHSLPLRHGMTVGELARMYNAELKYNVDLVVVPVQGWTREMWFDETGLPWINPSPNMRSLTAAITYPGIGLHETALTVGRGADTPFEIAGAPYIDDVVVADELNRAELPGVRFMPVRFQPKSSTFKDQECRGIYLLLTDRDRFAAVDAGIQLALTLQRLYPEKFALNKFQTLLQSQSTLDAIRKGASLVAIKASWAEDLAEFARRREPFLIYPARESPASSPAARQPAVKTAR